MKKIIMFLHIMELRGIAPRFCHWLKFALAPGAQTLGEAMGWHQDDRGEA